MTNTSSYHPAQDAEDATLTGVEMTVLSSMLCALTDIHDVLKASPDRK